MFSFPVPPSIRGDGGSYSVPVNHSLNLDCESEGIPLPAITWTKDGSDADELINTQVINIKLTISLFVIRKVNFLRFYHRVNNSASLKHWSCTLADTCVQLPTKSAQPTLGLMLTSYVSAICTHMNSSKCHR